MFMLLLALAGSPGAAAEAQATLQSCEMTPTGWVCHYKMPAVTVIESPDGRATVAGPPPPVPAGLPTVESEKAEAEAIRQARLIARCADASWLSLCLPADRREARRLRDLETTRTALRGKVTKLLSEARCDEAVKAALAGGDLALAREARGFCAP
ncbi:MAG: hypothetical protein Q8L66_05140 [Caulobacter sp.]|nr:hypothetical protein [Caulobacter sp.]